VGFRVQRFRGGLVFKAHRLCVSLNSMLESNKEEKEVQGVGGCLEGVAPPSLQGLGFEFQCPGCGVQGLVGCLEGVAPPSNSLQRQSPDVPARVQQLSTMKCVSNTY